MEKKIYLIYNDSMDDYASIIGYIEGTGEDAEKYCQEYNSCPQRSYWNKVQWEELDKLNK